MAELSFNLCVCVFSIIFQTFHGQFQKFKLYEYRYVLWPGTYGPEVTGSSKIPRLRNNLLERTISL